MAHGVDPEFPVDVPLACFRSSRLAEPMSRSVLEGQVDSCIAVRGKDVAIMPSSA